MVEQNREELYEDDYVLVDVEKPYISEIAFSGGAFFLKKSFTLIGEYGYLMLKKMGNKFDNPELVDSSTHMKEGK